jgi:hypothetical protein
MPVFFFFLKHIRWLNTRFYFVVIFLFSCPLLIKLEAKLMDDLHCERPLICVAAGRCTSWWWAHKKLGKKRTIYVFIFILWVVWIIKKPKSWVNDDHRKDLQVYKRIINNDLFKPFLYFIRYTFARKSLSLRNQFDRYLFGCSYEKK